MIRIGTKILQGTSEEILSRLITEAKLTAVREAAKVKEWHQQKLGKLKCNSSKHADNHVNIDKSKWVINLSDRALDPEEREVLQKGLSFAVVPKSTPNLQIINDVEVGIRNLKDADKDLIGAEVCNVLNSFKKLKSNISSGEAKAIGKLKGDISINILKGDKGNCVVIMNASDNDSKIFELLSDDQTYEEVKRNPIKKFERLMNSKRLGLKRLGKFEDGEYFRLRSTDGLIPRIYGLVKIHKDNFPLRPIVSLIGSPLYQLSKYISGIISPLVGNTPHTVKNSFDFVRFLSSCKCSDNDVMVSFDVISLFTRIPIELAVEIVKCRLENDDNLCDRTKLSVNEIVDLMQFCLDNNHFVFRGKYFRQIFGCAMGSPISVVAANLVMEDLERRILLGNCQIRLWKRFVDDVWALVPEDKVSDILTFINSFEKSINFTCEREIEKSLPFLDVLVTRVGHGFQTKVYCKPSHTDRYLDFNSNHAFSHKMSVSRCLYSRADLFSSDAHDKDLEFQRIMNVLRHNNFPDYVIRKSDMVSVSNRNDGNSVVAFSGSVSLPYIKGCSERISRVLKRFNIKSHFKPLNKLSKIFGLPKDPVEQNKKCGVVYEVPCGDCDKVYVGQTGNSLETRLKQHQAACRSFQIDKSALAEHSVQADHRINWSDAKVVTNETRWRQRLLAEAFHTTKRRNQALNRCDMTLPNVYKRLLT